MENVTKDGGKSRVVIDQGFL